MQPNLHMFLSLAPVWVNQNADRRTKTVLRNVNLSTEPEDNGHTACIL